MTLLKLREKLNKLGLVLLQNGDGWIVTNNGTAKDLLEIELPNLDAVEAWMQQQVHTNRLNDAEADEFDAEWAKWCMTENENWRK